MLNLNSLLLSSQKPEELIGFYQKVLGKPQWSSGSFSGFQAGAVWLTIGPHDKVQGKNPNPERLILNLETIDVKGEFERIKGLGAKVIKEPYSPDEAGAMTIVTFADPDGNYFQLMTPMKA